MSLKNERDSIIKELCTKYNLPCPPSIPFEDDVAGNLSNQLKSRLVDLDKDLQEKKVILFISCHCGWLSEGACIFPNALLESRHTHIGMYMNKLIFAPQT